MLFGIIFFAPLLSAAVGATLGAWRGSMTNFGIDDEFIESVRTKVTPGTSALFLLTSDAVRDQVIERLKKIDFELIASNLSKEDEEALVAAFAEE